MFKDIKIAALYVGSIIGAGFASGREIILFFYEQGFLSFILASIFLALSCVMFMRIQQFIVINKVFRIVVFVGMFFTYIMMLCASKVIFNDIFGFGFLSIISGVVASFIATRKLDFLKSINLIIVLLVIILLAFLSSKESFVLRKDFNLFSPIKYVCMNVLLGGVIVDSNKITKIDCIITGIIVFLMFVLLFYFLYKIAYLYPNAELPTFAYAKDFGVVYIAGIIIYGAIFTTKLSSLYMMVQDLKNYCKSWMCIAFFTIVAIISYNLSYRELSKYIYPILSYMGCVYVLYCIYLSIKRILDFNKFPHTFNCKIHNACHKAQKDCCRHN